jgi:hypothetical protein
MNSQIPTTHSRMFPRIGGLGIVFSVLVVGVFALTGNQPGTGASGAAVITYYHSHRVAETAAVFTVAVAAIVFTFFLSALRRRLGLTAEGRQLSAIVTAGGAVYTGGLLLMGVLTTALVDVAHYRMAGAAQPLNVLSSDDWVPVVAGLSMVTLGTGIAALRSGALPRWLAWASIGLGVLAVAGPLGAAAFLITPVWTLVVGIVLFRSPAIDPHEATVASASASLSRANS